MADADANKQLDSARKKSGRTSFHSEQFTYTWVIEEYSKCQNEQNNLEIVSPKIVVNHSNHKYEFKLAIYPLRSDPIRGGSNTCIDLQVLTCPSNETNVHVKRCFIRKDGTEYNPVSATFAIKNCAVFQNYCIAPSTVYSTCLSNGNLTIRCTFTFRRSVSRDKPEYLQLDAAKSIHDEFAELLYSGKFSDLTLDLGEKKFKVHKSILATRSPVFSAMFEHEMLENKENVVKITDVEPDIMSEILLFIYANKVNSIKELTAGIFAAADKYQLEALRLMCEDVFLEKLSLDNLTEILKIVNKYETCPRLRDAVLQFLLINGSEVANWKNFDNVMKTLSPALLFEVTKAAMMKS
ncbi:speckle-type POZ protein B isoform X1 [Nasonia vitripennis]|uniref:BTB domain-containing protein n=1 Tax=Nasonia vitripennis TaxID=7425 RepID=A0A7M7GE63_NASVI|nr:speckle-type POZ protein B isoform X1 [Nasonia vitripennis]XP_016836634.1 speckle-type POZ protein B isoform X1 [Nasonia vitripennis]XP_016836635.1 speckle-type POZ protein B isoform X1 [Nasonia vitripennis]